MPDQDKLLAVWIRGNGAAVIGMRNYGSQGTRSHEGVAFFWNAANDAMDGVHVVGAHETPSIDLPQLVRTYLIQWINTTAFMRTRQLDCFVSDQQANGQPLPAAEARTEIVALSFRARTLVQHMGAHGKFAWLKEICHEALRCNRSIYASKIEPTAAAAD